MRHLLLVVLWHQASDSSFFTFVGGCLFDLIQMQFCIGEGGQSGDTIRNYELAREPAGNVMYCILAAFCEQSANVLHSGNIA
jgi:hypothetical protein